MKIKWSLKFSLLILLSVPVYAQEGMIWWYGLDSADFIVEGVVTYDPKKYYEIKAVNIEGRDKPYYWLAGEVKINKILFINKHSEHLEEYQQYLKDNEKTYPVLIPALRREIWSAAGKTKFTLQPTLGLDITSEPTVLNLSEIYIFPILDLKLSSVVPVEYIDQAKDHIRKRPNNLLEQ